MNGTHSPEQAPVVVTPNERTDRAAESSRGAKKAKGRRTSEQRNFKRNRLFLLNDPIAPRLCPCLAAEIGLHESIVFLQFEFWLITEGDEIDNALWVRRSAKDVIEAFPFFSPSTASRTLKSLEESGLIVSANHNETPYDRTKWYAFNPANIGKLKSVRYLPHDGPLRILQNGQSDVSYCKIESSELSNGMARFENSLIGVPKREEKRGQECVVPTPTRGFTEPMGGLMRHTAPDATASSSTTPNETPEAVDINSQRISADDPLMVATLSALGKVTSTAYQMGTMKWDKRQRIENLVRTLRAAGYDVKDVARVVENWPAYLGKTEATPPSIDQLESDFERILNFAPVAARPAGDGNSHYQSACPTPSAEETLARLEKEREIGRRAVEEAARRRAMTAGVD